MGRRLIRGWLSNLELVEVDHLGLLGGSGGAAQDRIPRRGSDLRVRVGVQALLLEQRAGGLAGRGVILQAEVILLLICAGRLHLRRVVLGAGLHGH